MATALELPTVDTLREEQRALRAVLARLRRRLRLELLLELAADAAVVLSAHGVDPGLPRLVVSLQRTGPRCLAGPQPGGRSWRFSAFGRPGDCRRRGSTS